MNSKIRIGIAGYGNLGKGVKLAVEQSPDMELVAVFTRRDPSSIGLDLDKVKVVHVDNAKDYVNDIDVMILCGGSATDLPQQGPYFAGMFNTVDSFDTHARIPEYFNAVNEAALGSGKTSAISIGWDPGLFSLNRVLVDSALPNSHIYTFWGPGVSQGHSDAIRRIDGVKNAVQYTIPVEKALRAIRNGETPELTVRQKHIRDCYVVAEEGADKEEIARQIKNMPNYFAEYDTYATFISEEEFKEKHSRMPHGGFVIGSGMTEEYKQIIEFALKLESNPFFTASVLTAYARAVYRLNKEGQTGAKTVFDIPVGYLSPKTPEELRKEYL